MKRSLGQRTLLCFLLTLFTMSVLFITQSQAQEVKFHGYKSDGTAVLKTANEKETTYKGPLPVAQMPKIYHTSTKTMNATAFGDTVFTVYPGGVYKTMRLWAHDSSGNSLTDSFNVFVRDTSALHAGVRWVQVPCKNLSVAAQTAGLDVVPGDGKKILFEVMFDYPLTVKVVRVNRYAARTKSFISAECIRP